MSGSLQKGNCVEPENSERIMRGDDTLKCVVQFRCDPLRNVSFLNLRVSGGLGVAGVVRSTSTDPRE